MLFWGALPRTYGGITPRFYRSTSIKRGNNLLVIPILRDIDLDIIKTYYENAKIRQDIIQ